MGRRGPKPVDMKLLNMWEFEFYKAFHRLRDGLELPYSRFEKLKWVDRTINQARHKEIKKMSAANYFLNHLKMDPTLTSEEVRKLCANPANLEWAERGKAREIEWLERQAQPKKIHALAERRDVWNDLVRARTLSSLREVCERWKRLPDVRGTFAAHTHILANTKQFFFMKKRRGRFPRSDYADDSRLEYLARGMAGALVGVSPMTAIERLRNMKHTQGGPLWKREAGGLEYCNCWRCGLERSNKFWDVLNEAWKRRLNP